MRLNSNLSFTAQNIHQHQDAIPSVDVDNLCDDPIKSPSGNSDVFSNFPVALRTGNNPTNLAGLKAGDEAILKKPRTITEPH